MKSPHFLSQSFRVLPACVLFVGLLGGCAHEPSPQERMLGEAVRDAQMRQVIPRLPALPADRPIITDGEIAVHGIDRYHQSWVRPPAPISVLNIQSGGASAATAAMPR